LLIIIRVGKSQYFLYSRLTIWQNVGRSWAGLEKFNNCRRKAAVNVSIYRTRSCLLCTLSTSRIFRTEIKTLLNVFMTCKCCVLNESDHCMSHDDHALHAEHDNLHALRSARLYISRTTRAIDLYARARYADKGLQRIFSADS